MNYRFKSRDPDGLVYFAVVIILAILVWKELVDL
jgi:hypothetical protein